MDKIGRRFSPRMDKKQKLQFHKRIATGLFFLMLALYMGAVILQNKAPELTFVGYIKAFAEAAMVGALADWFAVTALFHKPLGLNIPHTNLIEAHKNDIGENLGSFVVENFLKPQQIRPYITHIRVSTFVIEWLSNENTATKINEMVKESPLKGKVANWLTTLIDDNQHQPFVGQAFEKVAAYLNTHKEIIESEIDNQFPPLIPSFIKDSIIRKVSNGLYEFISKASTNQYHPIRTEITAQLYALANKLNSTEWEVPIAQLLQTSIGKLTAELKQNTNLQQQIDIWAQKTAYQFVLRNKEEVGRLISSTVSQWEGRELSKKLELEVGKDLQFIRINGTLVGGMVGLLIYWLTHLFAN